MFREIPTSRDNDSGIPELTSQGDVSFSSILLRPSKPDKTGTHKHYEKKEVDGAYAWLVTVASFVSHGLVYGILGCPGLFYYIFGELYDSSSGTISLVIMISAACALGLGPIAGVYTDKYGQRSAAMIGGLATGTGLVLSAFATNLYIVSITFGVMMGTGLCFGFLGCSSIVPLYVEKWRTVALGIAVSGVGFGTFVYPPLVHYLVSNFGARGSLLILGGLEYNMCVCGALMRKPRELRVKHLTDSSQELRKYCAEERHINKESTTLQSKSDLSSRCFHLFNLHIFRNKTYIVLSINSFLALFGFGIFYIHIAAYAETHQNITRDMSTMLLSAMGIFNWIGRLAYGLMAQIPYLSELSLFTVSFCLCGLVVLLVPLAKTFASLLVMTSLFGFLSATLGTLLPHLIAVYLGVTLVPIGYGYLMVFEGLGNLAGPTVAGYLYDYLQRYQVSFYLAGATIILAGVIMFVPLVSEKVKVKRQNSLEEHEETFNTVKQANEV